jgi:hypothetical protein
VDTHADAGAVADVARGEAASGEAARESVVAAEAERMACALGGVTAYAGGAVWALEGPVGRAGESVLVVMCPSVTDGGDGAHRGRPRDVPERSLRAVVRGRPPFCPFRRL